MTIDELTEYGMQRMDEEEIETYLELHNLGVLALSTDDAPYLLPMSYGYDGDSRLYFTYILGKESRKAELSNAVGRASFLVYRAETMFHWRSVVLVGSLRELSESERTDLSDSELPAWRPELLEAASESIETGIFEFLVEERSGLKHTITPPGFWQRVSPDRSS